MLHWWTKKKNKKNSITFHFNLIKKKKKKKKKPAPLKDRNTIKNTQISQALIEQDFFVFLSQTS